MVESECLSFRETGYFSELICDYLEQKPALADLYGAFPTLENFARQFDQKASFEKEKRLLLADALHKQYARLKGADIGEAVTRQLATLEHNNCFTVTTGHQLNLFTGPLYFLYKIASVINMAKRLNEAYPDKHVVPVYWMATEDHDFAEINHIHHHGGRISWNREAAGPVGRLNSSSLAPVLEELEAILGAGKRSAYLIKLFTNAYLKQDTLADATRYIVHALFGAEGLLIVDGDDADLKRQMHPYFEADLLDHLPQKTTEKASAFLREHYTEQVHVRDINLFYIMDNVRERIEKEGEHRVVLNTDIRFTKDSLLEALAKHPERFSPNVVLRPLYQEVILPNLSYTGGGGELAYWLQLKAMFDAYKVPFPMLHLRNSVLWIPKSIARKAVKLDLDTRDLFKSFHALSNAYVHKNSSLETDLSPYTQKLKAMFEELQLLAGKTDATMQGAVNAQEVKQLKGIENLQKKLLKAEKKQAAIQMRQLEEVKQGLFPANSLQERHDNFIAYYMGYGEAFIASLLETLDPFAYTFTVLSEKPE
jgi:bacillithiol biosynthesis cysteine-adding enzyme BshC